MSLLFTPNRKRPRSSAPVSLSPAPIPASAALHLPPSRPRPNAAALDVSASGNSPTMQFNVPPSQLLTPHSPAVCASSPSDVITFGSCDPDDSATISFKSPSVNAHPNASPSASPLANFLVAPSSSLPPSSSTDSDLARLRHSLLSLERQKDREIFELKFELDRKTSELESSKVQSQCKQDELTRENASLSGEIETLQSKLDFLYSEEKDSKRRIAELMEEAKSAREGQRTAERELKRMADELSQLQVKQSRLVDSAVQKATIQLDMQTSKNKILEDTVRENESLIQEMKKQNQSLAAELKEFHSLKLANTRLAMEKEGLALELDRLREESKNIDIYQRKFKDSLDLEAKFRSLIEENRRLQDSKVNSELLKEQIVGYQNKIQRLEADLATSAAVAMEFEILKERETNILDQLSVLWPGEREKLRLGSGSGGANRLSQLIQNLQQEQMEMARKLGAAEAASRELSGVQSEYESVWKDAESKSKRYQAENDSLSAEVQRLSLQLAKAVKLRDSYKRALESYDNEDSAAVHESSQVKRIKELESIVDQQNKQIEELIQKDRERDKQRMEIEFGAVNHSKAAEKEVEKARQEWEKQKKEMEKEMERMSRRMETAEQNALFFQAQSGRGEYDSSNTKILHLADNPFSIAIKKKRNAEIERLKEENTKLNEKLQAMQTNGAANSSAAAESVALIELKHALQQLQQEKEGLVSQLKQKDSESEKRVTRLKEVFHTRVNEFRESCYLLTGFKIEMINGKTYKMRSMYAEQERDCLIFQSEESGGKKKLNVLETDFVQGLERSITDLLTKFNSIPAFCSAVTMELFQRQTRIA